MPAFLRRLRARIKYWNHADELRKELEIHYEMAAHDIRRDSESDTDTRAHARRLLGNDTIAREDARAVWVARWIEQLMQDIRYAVRAMRREWGFTTTATITLTLGIGALVGVFTVFNAIYLRPWPVRAPNEVFGISTSLAEPPRDGASPGAASRMSYVVWNEIRPSMISADLAVKYDYQPTLRTAPGVRGRGVRLGLVNDGFLDTIGIDLQMGSLPANSSVPAIAITHAIWQTTFGGDPAIVGRQIWLDDHPTIVTGVLEPRFLGFPSRIYEGLMVLNAETSSWFTQGLNIAPDILTNPKRCYVEILGRLRPGYSLASAGEEIQVRGNAAQSAFGLPALSVVAWHTPMASRPGGVKQSVQTFIALLFTGCAIVTLLACANLGNLQLARGLRRSREVAVRLSLGASRSRVIRQLLTESVVVTLFGAVGGLLVAWTVPPMIMSFEGGSSTNYSPDARVVVFALATAALAATLSGLAPALRVTRIDWRGAAAGVLPGASRLRGVLLATQIALSLALVASGSLLARGAIRAADGAGVGFETKGIYAYGIAENPAERSTDQLVARNALKAALVADPNIALADTRLWAQSQPYFRMTPPGATESINAQNAGFNHAAIALLRLPLVAGRWPDEDPGRQEAVISRSLARTMWQTEDVIGRTLLTEHPFSGKAAFFIVGVMDEVRLRDASPFPAVITAPREDFPPTVLGPATLGAELKTLVARADPTLRVLGRPIVADLRQQMEGTFIGIAIASGLGLVALLLAGLGVFGVFAYMVEERRREIGVRLALGATRSHVRRGIAATTRGPVSAGLFAGLALAIVGGFVLRSNLYGLSILDPLAYLIVATVLSFAATVATFIPLRRALRIDPAVTLRQD